jgi:hypothetical protein
MRVTSGFLSNSTGNILQTCRSGENLDFHVSGSGIGTFQSPHYVVVDNGPLAPEYSADGQNWIPMESAGFSWRVPEGSEATKIRFAVYGNPDYAPTRDMSTPYQIPAFNVNCQ